MKRWARLSPGPHDTPEVFWENRRTFDRLYREHRDRLSKYIWTSLAIGLASGYVNGNSCESWDMTRMDAENTDMFDVFIRLFPR